MGYPYAVAVTPPRVFLPVQPKNAMTFFQAPARRWWWGLFALVAYAGLDIAVLMLFANGTISVDLTSQTTTPNMFLINNISIATEIVICALIAWLFYRQGIGWLVSVTGRFRWRWLLTTAGIFAAGYVVLSGVIIALYGVEGYGFKALSMQPYTWFMLAAIVFTTPLQCAGEEFQSRALLPRLIAAIVPVKGLDLTLSALVPSLVFMLMHDAADPWLNLNYFCFALMMWWLAYRTGGIEASIALHLVNNLFSEWYLPFTNIGGMFDRSVGTGSASVLVNLAFDLVLVVIVDAVARRRGLVRESSPGAINMQAAPPPLVPAYPPPWPGYAPYWVAPAPPASTRYNALGTVSLVCGVIAWAGLVVGFVLLTVGPLAGMVAIAVGATGAAVAIAFGIPGIDAARHKESTNLTAGIAGLVLGGALVGLACLVLLLLSSIHGF